MADEGKASYAHERGSAREMRLRGNRSHKWPTFLLCLPLGKEPPPPLLFSAAALD